VIVEVLASEPGRSHLHETWRFTGSRGGPVLAEAYVSDEQGPVVVIGHGRDNSRHATYVSGAGRLWARRGITVIGADAPLHGDRTGADEVPETVSAAPELMAEWIADHRRLIDGVEERFPDRPIGYLGVSMGGVYGVHLVAAEERVRAAVFVVLGSNRVSFPERFPGLDGEWLERAAAVEPATPASRVADRPVLLLCADRDEVFSRASALDLYDAFRPPKELVFMPGTHAEWASPARWFRRMEAFLRESLAGRPAERS
jgi:alpha-beta hydrolase superfamily lysophospholipase